MFSPDAVLLQGRYYIHNYPGVPMTGLQARLNPQTSALVVAAVEEILLKAGTATMTSTINSLTTSPLRLQPASGSPLLNALKSGALEAVVVRSQPLGMPLTGANPQASGTVTAQAFTVTIRVQQQLYQLTTTTPLPAGTALKLTASPDNAAVMARIITPASTAPARSQSGTPTPPPALNRSALDRAGPVNTTAPETPKAGTEAPVTERITTAPANTAIEQGLRQALPLQQPLKNLLPVLQQISKAPPPNWPKALTHNLKVLLQQFPSAEQLQQPRAVKQAVLNSGVLLEARLAQQLTAKTGSYANKKTAVADANQAIKYDIKGLIQRLIPQLEKTIAATVRQNEAPASGHGQAPSPLTSPAAKADSEPTRQPLFNTPQTLSDLLPAIQSLPTTNKSGNDHSADVLLRQLGQQLIASLARSQLNQLESLANRQANNPDSTAPANSWTLELPIMQGNNIDTLTLRINQYPIDDEASSPKAKEFKQWTVMLDFDLHQLGKLSVQLKIIDSSVSATVWSERPHTHQEVKQHIHTLENSLQSIGVNVTQIDCQLGVSVKTTKPVYQQLVDVRT